MDKNEKKNIEKISEEILVNYNFNGEVGVIQIAQDNNFIVAQSKLRSYEQGFIFVNKDSDEILGLETQKLIVVNSELKPEEKRFVIAHELGHYFLHCKDKSLYAHRDNIKGKEDSEQDVDYFAACLLMPGENFSSLFNQLKKEKSDNKDIIKDLSRKFRVPEESAKRRIVELGLI